jgi:hypothetical protein
VEYVVNFCIIKDMRDRIFTHRLHKRLLAGHKIDLWPKLADYWLAAHLFQWASKLIIDTHCTDNWWSWRPECVNQWDFYPRELLHHQQGICVTYFL